MSGLVFGMVVADSDLLHAAVEELLRHSTSSERNHGDGSSVGSWSAAASAISRDDRHVHVSAILWL